MAELTDLPDISEMSHRAVLNQIKDVGDEIERVANKSELHEEDEQYLNKLEAHFEALNEKRKAQEREALVSRVSAVTGKPTKVTPGHPGKDLDDDPFGEPGSVEDAKRFSNPWNVDEMRRIGTKSEIAGEYRARAFSAIEQMRGTNDKRREAMTQIIERHDTEDGKLSKQLLDTSSPDYMRAFNKLARGKGHALSPSEQRAMSLTDTSGGYLVPFQLDPTVIITSDGTYNEIRKIARRVVATGDRWNGVSSGAVTWGVRTEASEEGDDSTTFAQPFIDIHSVSGFVPISFEALQDEQNVAQEVGRLLSFGKEDYEATAFATGSGTGPQGIVTALVASSPSVVVSAVTNNAFVAEDVYALDEDLPARYRFRASWLAHRAVYNDIRQFDTSGGGALWERLGADVPPLLLGKRAYESEAMDGALATADDYALIFGDFDNYVIADRIGTTVEFIPHLFHADNNRPSGQRGWFAYYRVGADSVNDGAFRLLKV
jgi:HK97 family phage major capsid protein